MTKQWFNLCLTDSSKNAIECLKESAKAISVVDISTKEATSPGRFYSADQQCKQIFGQKYWHSKSNYNVREISFNNIYLNIVFTELMSWTQVSEQVLCYKKFGRTGRHSMWSALGLWPRYLQKTGRQWLNR